ncbi:MAG: hypothetical protein SNJ53_08385, partial [Thermodesulfovibrionales bacterium]
MRLQRLLFLNALSLFTFIFFFLNTSHNISASTYTAFTTPNIVKIAIESALLEINDPSVEIVGQGSWISRQNYRDPRLPHFLSNPSDHDMRIVFRSLNVPDSRAVEVWKNFRNSINRQLRYFVDMGIIRPEELSLIRNSINIYPPEQLMRNIDDVDDALKLFNRLGIYPNLADVDIEGSFGRLFRFERQGYEKGARGITFYLDKGQVRTGSVDLVHMMEGSGRITGEALSFAARHNLEQALNDLNQGKIKDLQKHLKRARDYLKQAKGKVRSGLTPNDQALDDLTKKVEELWKRFEKIEAKTDFLDEVFGTKQAVKKTAEEIAEQKAILEEFKKIQRQIRHVVTEALDDTYLITSLEQAVKEGKYMQANFFRGLLSPAGKWLKARTSTLQALGKIKDSAKKIGFLNILGAYFVTKDLPQVYVNEGADKAAARLSMGIATLMIPELAVAELVSMLAVSVAEVAVDYVASYGYKAVTSTQDCIDLIAGIYTVYGRETAMATGGKKCNEANSLRSLACLVPDDKNLRWYFTKSKGINPKDIPSEIKSLIQCHAENASRRFDEPTKTDKNVEDTLVNKCLGTVVMAWLEEREIAIQTVQSLVKDIERTELRASYNPKQAVIPKNANSTSLVVSTSFIPSTKGEIIQAIKNEIECIGGKGSKSFAYEKYTWKLDGNVLEKKSSRTSMEFNFDKEGTRTICVEYELEYGGFGGQMTTLPEGVSGTVLKNACFDVDITKESPSGKLIVKILGKDESQAPIKAETKKDVLFAAKLENARSIDEYYFVWKVEPSRFSKVPSNNSSIGIFTFTSPGDYSVNVEVYDKNEYWRYHSPIVKDKIKIEPKKLGEAKHIIKIIPSIKDAKVEAKITAPKKIVLGNSIDMSVELVVEEHIKSRLKSPLWFRDRGRYNPNYDLDDEETL